MKHIYIAAIVLIATVALAACAPAPTPTPVPPPPTAVPPTATRVPPTATPAPPAELPVKWFLVRVEGVPDLSAPTEIKITNDGEDTSKAADGSSLTATGSGSFDPTSKKAAGSGKFTVKDSAGAVKSQGNWQVTDFVSWQQLAGGFPAALKVTAPPPPPGTIPSAGILTVKVKLDNLGDATMEIHCKLPTTPDAAKLLEGAVLTVGSTKYDTPQHALPTATVDPGRTVFYIPPSLATSMTFNLGAGKDADQSPGLVILTAQGSKTEVVVTFKAGAAGVPQPGHIHDGACPAVGAVKFPLTSAVDGKSTTVVDATLADILKGPYAVNFHKSAAEIGVYVACGNVK